MFKMSLSEERGYILKSVINVIIMFGKTEFYLELLLSNGLMW